MFSGSRAADGNPGNGATNAGANMQVIFVFLLIGALATVFLLRPEWAPKLREPVI